MELIFIFKQKCLFVFALSKHFWNMKSDSKAGNASVRKVMKNKSKEIYERRIKESLLGWGKNLGILFH